MKIDLGKTDMSTRDLWFGLTRKSSIGRKSIAYARQAPRAIRRVRSREHDYLSRPPIMANSFPKSGTHLLVQILEAIPDTINYGSFISTTPTITYKERSTASLVRSIHRAVPAELVSCHLFYHPQHQEALARKNAAHFFIYRDPRDVVISEAHYLTHMNRWHRLHPLYARRLKTDEERILTAITGYSGPGFDLEYPNVAARFARYQEWLADENSMAIRFEDLIADKRKQTVQHIMEFYMARSRLDHDVNALVQNALDNIDPYRSHTFREGKSGGWARTFTARHKEEMKRVAGDLLVTLGYEADKNW